MRVPVERRRGSTLGAAGAAIHHLSRRIGPAIASGWGGLALGLLLLAGALAGCAEDEGEPAPPPPDEREAVVCLGDSLTAGYGLDPDQAWPALVQRKVDAAGLPFRVVNAGVTGETTSGGLRRLDWILRQDVAVVILALGGNDGLRGIGVETVEENLEAMIDRVREADAGARVILAGMQAPPSMGEVFTAPFRALYPRVAEAKDVPLIPFLLEGVGGEADMNQSDGIHPNAAGQAVVAENVWAVLQPILREIAGAR